MAAKKNPLASDEINQLVKAGMPLQKSHIEALARDTISAGGRLIVTLPQDWVKKPTDSRQVIAPAHNLLNAIVARCSDLGVTVAAF